MMMDIVDKINIEKDANTLSSKSESILNVFKQTVLGLSQINDEVYENISAEEEKIRLAQEEKEKLEKLAADNTRIIDNMKNIIS